MFFPRPGEWTQVLLSSGATSLPTVPLRLGNFSLARFRQSGLGFLPWKFIFYVFLRDFFSSPLDHIPERPLSPGPVSVMLRLVLPDLIISWCLTSRCLQPLPLWAVLVSCLILVVIALFSLLRAPFFSGLAPSPFLDEFRCGRSILRIDLSVASTSGTLGLFSH